MIKYKKGNLIVLGLSDENLERLKKDQPIKFNLKELGLQDMDILIFNGKTEDEMYKQMKDAIDPLNTIFKDYRADKN